MGVAGMGQALSTPELQERVDLLLGPTGYAFSYGFSQFGKCFLSPEPGSHPPILGRVRRPGHRASRRTYATDFTLRRMPAGG